MPRPREETTRLKKQNTRERSPFPRLNIDKNVAMFWPDALVQPSSFFRSFH